MTNNILETLASNLDEMKDSGHPPVHLWNPEHCGEIDMVIQHDGSWLHEGSVIKRDKLVKLFSSVLWYEDGLHYLKTPAEKVLIKVETTPFLITQMAVEAASTPDQIIQFTTSYGDTVVLGKDHGLSLNKTLIPDQEVPLVEVRYGMSGRLTRSVFEELVELGEHVTGDVEHLKLLSNGAVLELPFG